MRALLALAFVIASAPASAAEPNPADEANAYCDALKGLATGEKMPFRILADVSSGRREGPPDWREFETDDERARQDTGDNLNGNANVYYKKEQAVYIHVLYQSPSRDWGHYVNYCFRPDGTLARISSELRTLHGRVRVVRTFLYDTSRGVLSQSKRVLDLESGEPVAKGRDFIDQEVPVFWAMSEFPFYKLLISRGAA